MHHDLVVAILDDRLPQSSGDRVQRLVPADPFPLALAAFTDPVQGVEDPVRVGDLVEGGRALGAVASARAGVLGVALELAHVQVVAVDVGQQTAG